MKKESIEVIKSFQSELLDTVIDDPMNVKAYSVLNALGELLVSVQQSDKYETKLGQSICLFTQVLTNLKISSVLLSSEENKEAKAMLIEDNNRLTQTVLDFVKNSYE